MPHFNEQPAPPAGAGARMTEERLEGFFGRFMDPDTVYQELLAEARRARAECKERDEFARRLQAVIDAVRAERDALAARVKALTAALREIDKLRHEPIAVSGAYLTVAQRDEISATIKKMVLFVCDIAARALEEGK